MDTEKVPDKIYGTYTGFLTEKNIADVTGGTELLLYFYLNDIGGMIWRMNHDAADGRITLTEQDSKNLIEAQYAIEFAVLQTRRFGVEIPEPKENEHVEITKSYNKWFEWWDEYINYDLPADDCKRLESLMKTKQDYSDFRPYGTWKV